MENELTENPYVVAKREQPERAAGTEARVEGYLAKDTEPGYWRVYLTSRLETYLRVPETDIVANAVNDHPMGKSVLTIGDNAKIEAVTPLPAQLQGAFLTGDFVSSTPTGASSPDGAGMASTTACIVATILIVVIVVEQTSPPPPPTNGGEPSICLC